MARVHSLSEDLLNTIQNELRQKNNWIAYNSASYHLEKEDVYFFNDNSEAFKFASNNYSDSDSYNIIYASSIGEIADKLAHGKHINNGASVIDVGHVSIRPPGEVLTYGQDERVAIEKLFNPKNKITMNQKNFEYLKDQVKFTGFGEGLENELKEKMQKQTSKFMLLHKSNFGKDETVSTLHFRKSDQSEMYFFNKYDVTLKSENKPEAISQTFYLNKGNNITLKEAYNLMNGRAVNKDLTNKEGQVYNAWIQLDMKNSEQNGNFKIKQFHQNYGFNLEKSLSNLSIKELSSENDKTALLNSLHKGNRQAVTFSQNGNEQRHYIEANPQFKSINIYDAHMKRQGSRQKKEEKQAQGESQSAKKEKQSVDKADPDAPHQAAKKGRRKSQSIA